MTWLVNNRQFAPSQQDALQLWAARPGLKRSKNSEDDVATTTDMKSVVSIKAHGQLISGISSVDSSNTMLTCSKIFTSLDVCTAQSGKGVAAIVHTLGTGVRHTQ